MKKILWLFFTVWLVARADAQSNAPVRLALIAEGDESSQVSDILSAELSKNPQVQLLERNEIDKVYREQELSAANRDYLKLGQVLGADGIFLLRASEPSNNVPAFASSFSRNPKTKIDLNVQLIAVRPGVLLTSERFSGLDDIAQWAPGFATHLNPFLPKLTVLPQDAVPISIVNLRAAIQSPEMQEEERQVTTLTIDRLSREPQLFVLERQNLQLLAAEKELKGLNDTAFWNGSFLLDGTLDRNGYSKDVITISARLVPPKGGTPLQIEVSGSRTNLADVINQLADKVRESLKLAASVAPWNAADEAQKYFEEATWSLRWNLLRQAQSASDSAWSLGKQDMECALVRASAYTRVIPEIDPENVRHIDLGNTVTFLSVTNPPHSDEIDQALQALRIYNEFSQALPRTEPQQDSPIYFAGLTALNKATGVLRHFHFHLQTWPAESGKLADLRAEVRRMADWISRSPSIRGTYWIQGHFPTHDEIYHDFHERSFNYSGEVKNFFELELQNARFWQDRPEDSLAQYRTLMESPLFVLIHKDLWLPEEEGDGAPRLMAWNAEDQKKIPQLWRGFITELDNSTNHFLRMEAEAAQFGAAQIDRHRANADWSKLPDYGEPGFRTMESVYAERDQKLEVAWTNLFDFVYANYDQIIAGRELLVYTGLELQVFFYNGGEVGSAAYKLQGGFGKIEGPKLNALSEGIRNKQNFEIQKQYLAALTPYDLVKFNKVFSRHDYSKEQAAELQPMLENYRSNIMVLANAPASDWFKKTAARNTAEDVARFERMNVESVLHPPLPAPAAPPVSSPVAQSVTPGRMNDLTNVLVVRKFLALPTEQLPATNRSGIAVVIFGERLEDDKLVLDVRYDDTWWQREKNGGRQRNEHREAVAIWDKGWEMIPSSHTEGEFGFDFILGSLGGQATRGRLFTEIFENNLYVSDRDAIRKYDFTRREWRELPFPGQNRAELFAVNHHLYAASPETIWEVLDGGQSSRILASTRRRPALSVLDTRESLGRPLLFPGKGNALLLVLGREIFSWDGNDWKPVVTIGRSQSGPAPMAQGGLFPGTSYAPDVFGETALFRLFPTGSSEAVEFWRFDAEQAESVLCWREAQRSPMGMTHSPVSASFRPRTATEDAAAPLWEGPKDFLIERAPVAMDASNIYFLIDRSEVTNTGARGDKVLTRQGRHADLVCLRSGVSAPVVLPIRFDGNDENIPVGNSSNLKQMAWMESSSDYLFIGKNTISGVWALPKAELQAEVDRRIKSLPPSKAITEAKEDAEEHEKLLAKYDLDHDGKINPKEREAAVSDPAFLEFDLDNIDTNRNGMLDVDELVYFDVNKNRRLDPSEAAGIHAVQQILAVKALKQFDGNENGHLDGNEFGEFTRNKASAAAFRAAQSAANGSEAERLKGYLERATEDKIQQRLLRMVPGWNPRTLFGSDPLQTDPTILKQEVDMYWARQTAP